MNQYRPTHWDEYVGQHRLKERLEIMIQAALIQQRRLDHILFIASPGSGKTSLASLIAARLDAPFESVIATSNFKSMDLARLLNKARGVLLIDEIHRLKDSVKEDLLPVIEEGYYQTTRHRFKIHDLLTIIGATTEPDQIPPALFDRFEKPPFDEYTDEEMALIIEGMASRIGLKIGHEACLKYGKASAGSTRQAKRIVNMVRDLAATNEKIGDWPEIVLQLAAITPEGLTEDHIKYLLILDNSVSGTVGLSVLQASMRYGKTYILELERALIRLGLIEYTPRGRSLLPRADTILQSIERNTDERR